MSSIERISPNIQRISPLVKSSIKKSRSKKATASKKMKSTESKRSTKKNQYNIENDKIVLTDEEINHLINEFYVNDNEKDNVFQNLKKLRYDSNFAQHNMYTAKEFYSKNRKDKKIDLYNQAYAIMMLLNKTDGNYKELYVNKKGRFTLLPDN